MEENIDLLDYWRIVKKGWRIIVAIPLIAMLTSIALTEFVLHPTYEATATVIVGKKQNDQANPALEYNAVMADQQIAKTYESIADSRTVITEVANEMGGKYTYDSLKSEVKINAVPNTEIISIAVDNPSATQAAQIANKLTTAFSKRVVEVEKVQNVSVVDAAVAPDKPVTPKKKTDAILALVVGLFVAASIVFLIEYLDKTVKDSSEVEDITGLPVLAAIPQFGATSK